MAVPLLIDTDPGIDDALALLLALASPEVSVEAITTVAGNVPVERCTENVFRILELLGPAPWPRVAQGAAAPLVRPLGGATHVHGDDGLGNLHRLRDPDGAPRYPRPSVRLAGLDGPDLILDTVGRLPHRLTIVALGPLTNLALALQRDSRRLARLHRLVVMGGAVWVPGNVTPAAEFNFYVDPEAAARVLAAGLPVELVPLDATTQAVLSWQSLQQRLAASPHPVSRFVADFTLKGFDFAVQAGEGGLVLHDPLAVGLAVDPSLAVFKPLHVDVECVGTLTRGMSVADRRSTGAKPPNCRVALSVDAPRFLPLFLDRLCPASS
jgi:purine nucleosidase/pyrimidine-specific ribonucleoside hydrolase